MILLFGLQLLLRGANLGIPYLSPYIDTHTPDFIIRCH